MVSEKGRTRLAEFENIGALAATEDNLLSGPRQLLDVFTLPEKVKIFQLFREPRSPSDF